MRRIVTWALSTITTLVLLFSYHTSTSSSSTSVQAAGTIAGSGSGSAAGSGSGSAAGNGSGSGSATAAGSTFTGKAVSTRFGNVQVQITVTNGKITAVTVPQYPNRDRKDVQINGYALPILNKEAVAAQSSDIDMVSGATITSVAYVQSLQSAIDQAFK